MLNAADAVRCLQEQRFGPFIGVPCSFLGALIGLLGEPHDGDYLPANNEGEAIAIAAGAYLAGRRPVVMFQNSGLGNAVNPLTSLSQVSKIPVLILTTLRGDPRGNDEPQHLLMGRITHRLLDLMEIPHAPFPQTVDALTPCLVQAVRHLEATSSPYALIVAQGTFAANDSRGATDGTARGGAKDDARTHISRRDAIHTIVESAPPDTLVLATTGRTSRELFEVCERAENFYVVGAMGCASSIGLGVALYQPKRRVIVLDGDGAALMRLEAMATIGHHAPANLLHVILDNASYDSTGGQPSMSPSIKFVALGTACGYRTATSVTDRRQLADLVRGAERTSGPHLVHCRVLPGSSPELSRPNVAPPIVALRFRQVASTPTIQRTVSATGS